MLISLIVVYDLVSDLVRGGLLEDFKAFLASVDADVNEFEAEMLELLFGVIKIVCVITLILSTIDLCFFLVLLSMAVVQALLGEHLRSIFHIFVLFESGYQGLKELKGL